MWDDHEFNKFKGYYPFCLFLNFLLFDACVRPILLHCSEVWSLYMINDITNLESKYWSLATIKIQIKFAKTLIGVYKTAVNLAVLAELGMYPVFTEA